MKRRSISTRERVELFQSANGICAICQLRITPGIGFDMDHIIPLAQGGEDDTPNFQIVCRPCHRIKSRTDTTDAAKSKRRQAKQIGAHVSRSPLPCGKRSPWKKKLNGQVVPR